MIKNEKYPIGEAFVVTAFWDSCEPIVYGLFDSYEEAQTFVNKWVWNDYDSRHELNLDISRLQKKGVRK